VAAKRPKIEAMHSPTLFPMEKVERGGEPAGLPNVERPYSEPGIYLGTSSFTASGWEGNFYPTGLKAREFLSYYATKFSTVEIDSTFYGTPSAATVTGWYEKTPADFLFAAKVPQIITHEKVLLLLTRTLCLAAMLVHDLG